MYTNDRIKWEIYSILKKQNPECAKEYKAKKFNNSFHNYHILSFIIQQSIEIMIALQLKNSFLISLTMKKSKNL